jgi:hypothetical protein
LIEIAGVVVGLLTLIFGDGLLRLMANLFMRRFRWEPMPFVDESHAIRAGISHDYPTKRVVTHALVVAPQPLLRRLLYLFRGERLPRRILVGAPLFEGRLELEPGVPECFEGQLPAEAAVPTWNVFKSRVRRQTSDVRLLFLVQAGRRRAKTRKLELKRGVLDPGPVQGLAGQAEQTNPQ